MYSWRIANPGRLSLFTCVVMLSPSVNICTCSIAEIESKLNQPVLPPLVIPSIDVGDVCAARFPVDNKYV